MKSSSFGWFSSLKGWRMLLLLITYLINGILETLWIILLLTNQKVSVIYLETWIMRVVIITFWRNPRVRSRNTKWAQSKLYSLILYFLAINLILGSWASIKLSLFAILVLLWLLCAISRSVCYPARFLDD